jgi:hypothetical protein
MLPLFNFIKNNNLYNIPIYGASVGFSSNLQYIDFFDK